MIGAITGHKTMAMIVKYADPARQRAWATDARERRGTNMAWHVEKGD
ncbi:hypothetical protein [Paracoccus sp. Ld10]